MYQSFRKTPLYRVFILSALVVCILLSAYIVSKMGIGLITYGDSVQYWAAGKLMLAGSNPYSPEQVLNLRLQAGNLSEFPEGAMSMMLYPPWTIPFLLPFGIFDYPISRLFWLIFNITVILLSTKLLWSLYGGARKYLFVAYILAFIFPPTIFLLGMGHITALHLLGLTGFLYFTHNSGENRSYGFLAGVCAALVVVKPQLQYLFVFALLVWVIDRRNWLLPVGGAITLIGLTGLSFLLNNQVINQYLESMLNYEVGTWVTPTLGSVFRLFLGWENEWLQVLPIGFGIVWFLYHYWHNRSDWNWLAELPLLILVGVVTSPYIWTYDMVVFVIPVLAVASEISRMRISKRLIIITVIYFTLNIFSFSLHRFVPDHWQFWYAPTMLILYLVTRRAIQEEKVNQRTPEIETDQASQYLTQ